MTKAKILVIDDEPGIRALLTQELTAQGYEVASSGDSLEAVKRLERERYQVVLCDINMPKLGGLEVLAEILRHDPVTRVIMMTGYGTDETVAEAMLRGAFDFVQKPFNLTDISSRVKNAVTHTEADPTESI